LSEFAARQHGVVTRQQLRALGLSDGAIQNRIAARRLHRIHRNVYAVGHAALSPDGRRMAEVLACGEGAVLSHRTAAMLWGLVAGGVTRWLCAAHGIAAPTLDAHLPLAGILRQIDVLFLASRSPG
jgi:hypothetical protein